MLGVLSATYWCLFKVCTSFYGQEPPRNRYVEGVAVQHHVRCFWRPLQHSCHHWKGASWGESCADVATGSQKGRQGCRVENFFVGKSQPACRHSPELERSLSSSGTSATDDEGTKGRAERFHTTYASKRLKTAPIRTARLHRKPFSCHPKCPQDQIAAYVSHF